MYDSMTCSLLSYRSVLIDHILTSFKDTRNKLVYVYFDYKAQDEQSFTGLVGYLLRQACLLAGYIPQALERHYEEYIQYRRPATTDELVQILTDSFKDFQMYAIFDAFDEYGEAAQKRALTLFPQLQQAGYRLLVSARPHLTASLEKALDRPAILRIEADQEDLHGYVQQRVQETKNFNETLETQCLELISDVQGV
jgi:hypothetical protein